MPFAAWWRGDPLLDLAPLPPFSARQSTDTQLIAHFANQSRQVIDARFQRGDRLYLACIGDLPVAYGWVATQTGCIDNLHLSFTLPVHNCYLYDFLTLPTWRGQGIYPHLLQAILRQEASFERFWIGYAPGNAASGRGISKAGFHEIGDLVFIQGSISGVTFFEESERTRAIADFLHLPVVAAP